MMIDPESYVACIEDTFEKLIEEQDELIQEIKELEKIVYSKDRSGEMWNFCPGPDVDYQWDLEALALLCQRIKNKYNSEIVWKEKA